MERLNSLPRFVYPATTDETLQRAVQDFSARVFKNPGLASEVLGVYEETRELYHEIGSDPVYAKFDKDPDYRGDPHQEIKFWATCLISLEYDKRGVEFDPETRQVLAEGLPVHPENMALQGLRVFARRARDHAARL